MDLKSLHTRFLKSLVALFVLVAGSLASPAAQTPPGAAIFEITTNEFWLNLHNFLYVLGQAQGRASNTLRDAVKSAPGDAERGTARLSATEQKTWTDAVGAYEAGLSKRDPLDDEPLAATISALAAAGGATSLAGALIDADTRAVLERVAPIYRKAWWHAHRSQNQALRDSLQRLLDQRGRSILDFITRAYALPWPAAGYPVHLSAYTSWAGAYSTYGSLLLVATNANASSQGLDGIETIFHEGMHQWDGAIESALRGHARVLGKDCPAQLSHAMIFFTAGEAVRRVSPGYVPVAERLGMWRRGGSGPVRAALDEIWKPYLDGRGTRDEALAALVAKAAVAAPAAQASAPQTFFTFKTDEFWMNLHQFLYVLGRAEARMSDASEEAVAGAPVDAARVLGTLSEAERSTWARAVAAYASGLGLKSVLESPMPAVTAALAEAGDAPSLSGVPLDPALVMTLESAAPIYRKGWWPAHVAANRRWRSSVQALLDRDGRSVIDFVTRAYGIGWPGAGRLVHVSSYTNFGGAYSSGLNGLLVCASLTRLTEGLNGLEAVVHEAMHQWDGQMFAALGTHARAINAVVPPDLPHALIFFTAGDAVRRVEPTHVPMAEAFAIWPKKLSGASLPAERLKIPLEEIWKPYLDGRAARDEALAALVARAAAVSRP